MPIAIVLLLYAGCGNQDPFTYVRVSGKVTYEDGSRIPANGIVLTFYPQGGALDPKTHPRLGVAPIDPVTGAILEGTSHKYNDGLVRGRHKVTISRGGRPLPPNLVPPEYFDRATTPLEVDTATQPLLLKVRKPR